MSSHGDLVREACEMLVLLYEFPAETRLTVYRRLDIPNRGELAPGPGAAHICKIGRRLGVFSHPFYYELLVCYIQSSLNILKLNFV